MAIFVHFWMSDEHEFDKVMREEYQTTNSTFTRVITLFAKWDGLMFVKVFMRGYDNLKMHAFFPGFPIFLKMIFFFLDPIFSIFGFTAATDGPSRVVTMIFIGLLLNLGMHVINNILVYR